MDSKNALEAVAAIRETVPVEELEDFDSQLAEQYGHAVEATGSMALGVSTSTLAEADEVLKGVELSAFLNPERELSAEIQLKIMGEFWGKLGYEVPELNEDQQAQLTETIEANPSKRVMPTPLLSVNWRKQIAERAKQSFAGQQFSESGDALWTPIDLDTTYGKLLRAPTSTVKEGRTSYGLRYKSPDGEIVGRQAYHDTLLASGRAVQAQNGTTWIFPVMDVQVQSERTYDTAANLHQRVDPTVAPESLIAMQLLHQANGTPNPNWHVDFANEAVVELDRKGDPKAPVQVASVDWGPSGRQVNLRAWRAGNQDGLCGVRGAESGLKA